MNNITINFLLPTHGIVDACWYIISNYTKVNIAYGKHC